MTDPIILRKNKIPLSLYIHLPWCKKKCPYCDFNSHEIKDVLPEKQYCEALFNDFLNILPKISERRISTIFFGGGTPNLFSPKSIKSLLNNIKKHIDVDLNAEVTLEANPGCLLDEENFLSDNLFAIKEAGVSRLSVGIQSFNDQQLKKLGRDYNGSQAFFFLKTASNIFSNINVDIMYGNPGQNIHDANEDLNLAFSFGVNHFSLYQLTIEPNTFFYKNTPTLPNEDKIWEMYNSNMKILEGYGYHRYEVSAFSLVKKECKHNLNYWQFGDYIGIGAGAHSKLTFPEGIERHYCKKNPNDYIDSLNFKKGKFTSPDKFRHRTVYKVNTTDLAFEFMLNGLRLVKGVNLNDFVLRTGCSEYEISRGIDIGVKKGLLKVEGRTIRPSIFGMDFLNDLQLLFMPGASQ